MSTEVHLTSIERGGTYPITSVQEECVEEIRKFKKSFMLSFRKLKEGDNAHVNCQNLGGLVPHMRRGHLSVITIHYCLSDHGKERKRTRMLLKHWNNMT